MIRLFFSLALMLSGVAVVNAEDKIPDNFSRVEMCVYQNLNNPTRGVVRYSVIDENGKNVNDSEEDVTKYISEDDKIKLKPIFSSIMDKVSAKFDIETAPVTDIRPQETKPSPPPAGEVKGAEPTPAVAPTPEPIKEEGPTPTKTRKPRPNPNF